MAAHEALRKGVPDRAVVEMRLEPARRVERDLERRRLGRLDGQSLRRRAGDEPARARISMVVARGAAPATSPQK
jgi:hypothetical protein